MNKNVNVVPRRRHLVIEYYIKKQRVYAMYVHG